MPFSCPQNEQTGGVPPQFVGYSYIFRKTNRANATATFLRFVAVFQYFRTLSPFVVEKLQPFYIGQSSQKEPPGPTATFQKTSKNHFAAPKGHQGAPKSSQGEPRSTSEPPQTSQEPRETAQELPSSPQEFPRNTPGAPKEHPGAPRHRSRAPKEPPGTPRSTQESLLLPSLLTPPSLLPLPSSLLTWQTFVNYFGPTNLCTNLI